MGIRKPLAILLLLVGLVGVGYGGFSYRSDTHRADLGPLHVQVAETRRVNIPLWVGIAALVTGAVLLTGASER